MEETNYDRATVEVVNGGPKGSAEPQTVLTSSDKSAVADAGSAETGSLEAGQTKYKEKTYIQRLALWDAPRKQRMPYRAWLSLKLVTWPVVFYAGFSYGSYLIWFNVSTLSTRLSSAPLTIIQVLNATASVILGGPGYNFSSSMVGLSYLAAMVGVIAASFYTGILGDIFTLKLARRNKGVFEPEQRLWGFALLLVVLPASLLLWGVGAAHNVHWFGLIVAMCGTAFANTCGITLSVNYLVDSYRDIGGDGMTTVMIIRNTMSFAISYGITPWLTNLGYQDCFVSAAFVGLAASSVFLLVVWKGKSWREANRVKYWTLVRKHIDMGMVH